jgi:acyl-CoA reductase-like NAD-dependent aldehyde dehydrogenase
MTDSLPSAPAPAHRRSNFILRALIDEMLEQVRELDRHSAEWTPKERAQREREVDELMARVRRAALKGPPA